MNTEAALARNGFYLDVHASLMQLYLGDRGTIYPLYIYVHPIQPKENAADGRQAPHIKEGELNAEVSNTPAIVPRFSCLSIEICYLDSHMQYDKCVTEC